MRLTVKGLAYTCKSNINEPETTGTETTFVTIVQSKNKNKNLNLQTVFFKTVLNPVGGKELIG